MTKEITELLDYLKINSEQVTQAGNTVLGLKFREWATAVEQLQENLHEAKIENTINITKVQAYERILDKGTGVVSLGLEPLTKAYAMWTDRGDIGRAGQILKAIKSVNVYGRGEFEKTILPAQKELDAEEQIQKLKDFPYISDMWQKPGESEDKVHQTECHCGKDGHALNSINCPVHGDKVEKPLTITIESDDNTIQTFRVELGHRFEVQPNTIIQALTINRGKSENSEAGE